jgi:hypothetical protein
MDDVTFHLRKSDGFWPRRHLDESSMLDWVNWVYTKEDIPWFKKRGRFLTRYLHYLDRAFTTSRNTYDQAKNRCPRTARRLAKRFSRIENRYNGLQKELDLLTLLLVRVDHALHHLDPHVSCFIKTDRITN